MTLRNADGGGALATPRCRASRRRPADAGPPLSCAMRPGGRARGSDDHRLGAAARGPRRRSRHRGAASLGPAGVGLRRRRAGAGRGGRARVLRAELFGDARRLRREYRLDARPTLIVVATAGAGGRGPEFLKAARRRGARAASARAAGAAPGAAAAKRRRRGATAEPLQFSDELTGLANRKRWQALLAQELARTGCGVPRRGALRPRPLQADQRPLRPPDRRPGAARIGGAAARDARAWRPARALGRREFVALLARYDRATVVADVQRMLQRLADTSSSRRPPRAAASSARQPLRRHRAAPLDGEPLQRMAVSASAGLAFVGERSTFADLMSRPTSRSTRRRGAGATGWSPTSRCRRVPAARTATSTCATSRTSRAC